VFIVPGLIGVILTMTMVMLTSMAIVSERERGTLEQLVVSPVKQPRARRRQDRALHR
jgi:ABC-2 type transport system permease protein